MSLKKLLVGFITLLLILTGCSSTPEESETPVVADPQPEPDPAEPIEEPQEPPVSDPFDFKIDADFPSDPAAGTFLLDKYELTKPYLDIGYDVLKTNINMFLLELSGDNPRTIYELEQFNYVDDPTGLGPSNWFMVRHHNPNGSEEMIDYNEFSALIDGTVSTFTNVLGLDYETYMRYTQEARENIKTEEAFNYDSEMVEVIKYQLESTGINMENPDVAESYLSISLVELANKIIQPI